MIQMNFSNGQEHLMVTCHRDFAQAFVWDMNDKGFVWVSSTIL